MTLLKITPLRMGHVLSEFVKKPDLSKLVLGTAQLGMYYGISNSAGKPDATCALEILSAAYKSGIRFIDTAQQYGSSEQLIGTFLKNTNSQSFKVISKIHPAINLANSSTVIRAAKKSYLTIGKPLAGMLIHDPAWLTFWNDGIRTSLQQCIEKQYIEAYGVSVYSPDEFNVALSLGDINIIQFPANVLDRRFSKSSLIAKALDQKKKLFIRSVFLQGLLIMPIEMAVNKIPQSKPYLERWHALCNELDMAPGEVALKYVSSTIPDNYIIVGCERPEQVSMNRDWYSGALPDSAIREIDSWSLPPLEVINPVYWTR